MKRICLVLADATRARIFTYESLLEPDGPHEQFREQADLVDPARRHKPSDLFSDSGSGNQAGVRANALDDHREAHLEQMDTTFAKEIAAATTKITGDQGYHKLVVLASSRMLAALRSALEPLQRTVTMTEFQRDYTKLPIAELRERLVDLDVLPPRVHAQM